MKQHWIEESQHVKLDFLELEKFKEENNEQAFDNAIDEYLEIINAFYDLLKQQTLMDLDSLSRCSNRTWSDIEKSNFIEIQHYSYLHNFILLGLQNRNFLKFIESFYPKHLVTMEEKLFDLESKFSGVYDAA